METEVEAQGSQGFVTMVSLESKWSLRQEHLEEFTNVFDFKKADFGRMWYAPRNFLLESYETWET